MAKKPAMPPIGDDLAKLLKAALAAAGKTGAKNKKANDKLGRDFIQGAKNNAAISSWTKQLGRQEVKAAESTGRYVSTTGKARYVSKEAAEAAGIESTGINKGMSKRVRDGVAKHQELKKNVRDAPDAASKRDARKILRDFEDRTGFR